MKMSNMRNLCLILLGNTVYALAIVMFILPNDIITGGTDGAWNCRESLFWITDPYICTDLQHTDVSFGGCSAWYEICTYYTGQYVLLSDHSGNTGECSGITERHRR